MTQEQIVWERLKQRGVLRRLYNQCILATWLCRCSGVMEYTYHSWWKCRECGRWQTSDF